MSFLFKVPGRWVTGAIILFIVVVGGLQASTTGRCRWSFQDKEPDYVYCGPCFNPGGNAVMGTQICHTCLANCVVIIMPDCNVERTGTWSSETVDCVLQQGSGSSGA